MRKRGGGLTSEKMMPTRPFEQNARDLINRTRDSEIIESTTCAVKCCD
jgi:hypothetical protein